MQSGAAIAARQRREREDRERRQRELVGGRPDQQQEQSEDPRVSEIRSDAKFEVARRGYALARRKGVSKVLARRQLERRLIPLADEYGVPASVRSDAGRAGRIT